MKKITVTVSPAGNSTLTVEGVVGPGCQNVSEFLDSVLGRKISEELKPEYYEPPLTNEVSEIG